ncbi:MAG: IclR family transcriptional regulator [Janthinobacterium lividum]
MATRPLRSPTIEDAPVHAARDDRQFVVALARGLAILRCFDASRQELGTTEIAQLTSLPQPTVWRLCYTLQELGYLVPSRSGDKLRIGMGVLGLGHFALTSSDIGDIAFDDMRQIAKHSRAAISISILEQTELLIIKRVVGDGPLLLHMEVGSRLPMGTTAGGWAYMAGLSEEARRETFARLKPLYGRGWTALSAKINKAIEGYRTTGFVLNIGGFHDDVNSVGAPVLDTAGTPIYSINCGGLARGLSEKFLSEEIGPRVVRLATKMRAVLAAKG